MGLCETLASDTNMNFIEQGVQELRFSVGSSELACSFCTKTSASFVVQAGNHRGWVDVHYPCHGHVKVQIRGAFPADQLDYAIIHELIVGLLLKLAIPQNETYEALFFRPTDGTVISQPVNTEGKTDRIETMRSWSTPRG